MQHLRLLTALTLGACLLPFAHAQQNATVTDTHSAHVTASPALRITLTPDAPVLSTFMGLGIEFDPYQNPPSPARWKTMERRVAWAHPGFFRVMSSAQDYCLGFDAQGKPIFVWQHPTPAAQERLNKLYAVLDFAQQHHIRVYLGEWSPPEALGIHSPADPRWPAIIADFVAYLVHVRHYTVIRHYIFFNEPNGQWMWPHSAPDFDAWSTGIRHLRRDFNAHGLRQIAIAGPDNSGDMAWFDRSVKTLHQDFGAWEMHIYATDAQVFGDQIETQLQQARQTILTDDPNGARKERFIAESGLVTGKIEALDRQPRVRTFPYGVEMSDYVAQIARAGWMGADAWDLDDAMHGDGHGMLKLWGFWNSSPGASMAIRPWFYTWSLMSRLFPAGAQIVTIHSTPAPPRFRVTAAHWSNASGTQTTVMLVNDSATPRTVALSLPGLTGHALTIYRYFRYDRPVNAAGLAVPAASVRATRKNAPLTLHLPGAGVIFVTTAAAGGN
jgi:hypothetical protein